MKYFFFLILKKFILYGKLDIEIGNDPVKSIVGQLDGPNIHIQILNLKHLFLIVRSPELSFGELYMNKELKIKKGNLEDLMKFLMLNYNSWQSTNFGKIRKYLNDLKNFFSTFNPIKKAKRNAAHHYDLNDDLFESFLDKRRQYSCGFFYSKNESLEDAQINKVSRLVAKLQINKGNTVLDIGCGWGGLGLSIYNCNPSTRITGITLSEKQHIYFNQLIKKNKLTGKVECLLKDYRELDNEYDRIVSVGMLEHVGHHNFEKFFQFIENHLKPKGVAVIHSIGRYGLPAHTNPWLEKYIFPGGYLPTFSQMTHAIEKTSLKITDIEVMRLHYAETLKKWREKFFKNKSFLPKTYDEKFSRMWEFYLLASEYFFRSGGGMVFQFQLAKDQEVVPLDRKYISSLEKKYSKLLKQKEFTYILN
ncbi:MAG: cyclopropane-fatty-acyl-phospholipid synthase [Alphaproteobacteria bacterium]|jgi:cyclopropane-fatty-acyl-phospholipid synthase|nr:MAG: cyclopropane-fatty-acyl-phospholipid synthase [Alphaproteobacteria bacterium]|tara:strand:+ start:1374 stop:2630 length:1257 start_codon:yes stop_codon:yes gene_type:complete